MATTVRPAEDTSRDAFVWRIAIIAGLSGILFGYDASAINDAIGFIQGTFGFDNTVKGVVVGALLAGATVGSLLAGFIADRIGRRTAIIISAALFIVSVAAASLAPDVEVLVLARLVIGFAIGVTSAVTPLYIAELAPSAKRGGMVTLYQLAITVGIFIAFLVGYALTADGNWRLMVFLAVVPAAVQLLFMWLRAPETPRFLFSKGRDKQAEEVLSEVAGPEQAAETATEIREVMATESSASYADIFRRAARPALLAGLGLGVIQAITGINVIMYYSTYIFQLAGFTGGNTSELNSLVVGIVNMVTTVVAIRLVMRFPRRQLLILGTAGMAIALAIGGLGLLLATTRHTGGGTIAGWITLIAVMAYVVCFAFGLGPLAWVVISEIFPLAIRGRAAALATSANWFTNFVVGTTFPMIVGTSALLLSWSFFGYSIICVLSIIYIVRFVPETKDRTLEEIEAQLHRGQVEGVSE